MLLMIRSYRIHLVVTAKPLSLPGVAAHPLEPKSKTAPVGPTES